MDWNALTIHCPKHETLEAIRDPDWQLQKTSIKGCTLEFKYQFLVNYLAKDSSRPRQLRVANYVNALRRAGLVAPHDP